MRRSLRPWMLLGACAGVAACGEDAVTQPNAAEADASATDGGRAPDAAGTLPDGATATDDSGGVDAASDGGSGGGDASPDAVSPSGLCAPLPTKVGTTVMASTVAALETAVATAPANATILVADGTYTLDANLAFKNAGVTLRSASGARDKVILDASYNQAAGEPIQVFASDVTIASITIAHAYFHAIHVSTLTGTVTGVRIHDVHVIDPAEQGIKINANTDRTLFTDNGEVSCSTIELTDAGRAQVRNNCYTGGIDGHYSRGWRVHDNTILGFWCAQGLSEHAIHFWTGSRDTIVERNVMKNNARGVGFGLGDATAGRTYADSPCPGTANVGHFDGIIRNNMVWVNQAAVGFDSGIALEKACGTKVLHNTIFSTVAPFSSIEWRFPGTAVTLTNNLTSHDQKMRDGAVGTSAGNVTGAVGSWFVNAAMGDLHLAATATQALDKGVAIPGGLADEDIDAQARAASPDVGADERP